MMIDALTAVDSSSMYINLSDRPRRTKRIQFGPVYTISAGAIRAPHATSP